MDKSKSTVDAEALRTWLENGDPVFVLDIRPSSQSEEWQIAGSHYLDAYKRLNDLTGNFCETDSSELEVGANRCAVS